MLRLAGIKVKLERLGPVLQRHPQGVMHSLIPSKAARPLRVLVVEDEALIRWAVVETLTEAGHTVLEAADAATAIQTVGIESQSIDVVLLDFRLPDSADLSLLKRIRQQSPSTGVVMMTAHGTPQMVDDAKALGAYEVIGKPFDMRTLEKILVAACRANAS
jgi:DNA-binding NtrC family response regulator